MTTNPPNVLCPKCWKRDPKLCACSGCGEQGCEACLVLLEGGATCADCWPDNLAEEGLPICPNCGERANFTDHSGSFTETHGLNCGPYETWSEEWLTCNKCGAKTDAAELAAMEA